MDKIVVQRSIWINAPRERVWAAIIEPEQLGAWFLAPALGAQLQRNGDQLAVAMGPMSIDLAILEGIDAPRQMSLRGLPDRLLAATFALDDENGDTRVTVTMTGFESLSGSAVQERLGPSGAGWEKALQNLKAYVDGAALPFPEGLSTTLFGYRRETTAGFAVERSIWIKASRERVWTAITDPDQVGQWFSPGTQWRSTGLKVGGTLSVYDAATDSDMYTQVIDVVDPLRQLVTRTADEPVHVTTWSLTDENGGTRLTITHSGYENEPAEARHNSMEQNAFGFGMMLENVKALIEGNPLPIPGGF